jgi:hypothetical protein
MNANLTTKTKIYHGDTRHGGQAAGTEKCSNKKSKTKIKPKTLRKAGEHRKIRKIFPG